MKIDMSSKVRFVPAWRGNDKLPSHDQFSVDVTTLTMNELFDIMGMFMELSNDRGDVDLNTVKSTDAARLIQKGAEFGPHHLTFYNLEDNDGPIDPARVFSDPRFTDLAVELIGKLIEVSSPGEADEGN